MLEEVKDSTQTAGDRREGSQSIHDSQSSDEDRFRNDMSPAKRAPKRLDSPNDAFKDVFSEYGAKLSPALMRL